jgi:hypothetical protein
MSPGAHGNPPGTRRRRESDHRRTYRPIADLVLPTGAGGILVSVEFRIDKLVFLSVTDPGFHWADEQHQARRKPRRGRRGHQDPARDVAPAG